MDFLKYIVVIAIGALASMLANRGIAVFNDGFRAIVPQYYDGQISRKELGAMSFAISFGLVIGFGLPTSIAATIILIHCLLLTTDIIGTWCPDSKTGLIASGVIGGVYGLLLLVGLEFIVKVFGMLPYNFLNDLGSVSVYMTIAFAIFPAVAVAYQHGFGKGAITAVITVIAWFLFKKFGTFNIDATHKFTLNADGMAMLVGVIMMLIFAAQIKGEGASNAALTKVFSAKLERIRKNWFLLAIMGGLLAAGTSLSIVAGDPASLAALGNGQNVEGGMIALARAIGFVPLVFTTSIVTGVYAPAGCTFVFVVGMFLFGTPLVALLVGAAVMIVELLLINVFANVMDKMPGVKEMGEHIRTSMNKVIEITLMVGAVVGAEKTAAAVGLSGIGAMFVIGCVLLNRRSKKPIVEMAIGPVACILFGLLANVLLLIGLVSLPA